MALLENKAFFYPIFIRKLSSSEEEKKILKKKKNIYIYINSYIPTYPFNQNIQGRGTANKQFFKDGLKIAKFTLLVDFTLFGTFWIVGSW